jgi:hypothetical protein
MPARIPEIRLQAHQAEPEYGPDCQGRPASFLGQRIIGRNGIANLSIHMPRLIVRSSMSDVHAAIRAQVFCRQVWRGPRAQGGAGRRSRIGVAEIVGVSAHQARARPAAHGCWSVRRTPATPQSSRRRPGVADEGKGLHQPVPGSEHQLAADVIASLALCFDQRRRALDQ